MQHVEQAEHLKHASLDPTALAALLLALSDGLALQKIMDSTFDIEAAYRLLAQMLRGLLANVEEKPTP